MVRGHETLFKNAASQFGGVQTNAARIVDHEGNAVARVRTDIGSTAMPAFNQTFPFEQLKRPANGDPGESELFTETVFGGQFFARLQRAVLNHLSNFRCNLAVSCPFEAHEWTESQKANEKSNVFILFQVSLSFSIGYPRKVVITTMIPNAKCYNMYP